MTDKQSSSEEITSLNIIEYIFEEDIIESKNMEGVQCCGCDDHAPCSCECGMFMG